MTLPFSFPAVRDKKITADSDGGRLTSDGGVILLAMAERRLGIAARLARLNPDRRDPMRVTHHHQDNPYNASVKVRRKTLGLDDEYPRKVITQTRP